MGAKNSIRKKKARLKKTELSEKVLGQERKYRSCGRKIFFASREGALKRAVKIGSSHVRAYKCDYCAGWHVGGGR